MDSKLSQLTQVQTVSGNALLYVSDQERDRSIAVRDLLRNSPETYLPGAINLSPDVQIMDSGGEIDISVSVTDLHINLDSHNITIPNPEGSDNQLKIIVVTSAAGGQFILSGNNIHNNQSRVFTTKNDTAMLLFYTGLNKWIFLN